MISKKNYLFIIGAPKCGTTSLAATLNRHPEIAWAKNKETMLFTDFAERRWSGPGVEFFQEMTGDFDTTLEWEYENEGSASWRLEGSTDNLSCSVSAQRIADFTKREDVGEIRIVAILRDPVLRAVSEYQHTIRDGLETKSLKKSLKLESKRLAGGMSPLFGHVFRSSYASQIARYREVFGDNFLILDYHRLADGREVADQITDYVGLSPVEVESVASTNKSFVYRSGILRAFQTNDVVVSLMRILVPKGFRAGIQSVLSRLNRTEYRPSEAEFDLLRHALKDEIAACVADPAIPTDRWTAALGR